MGGPEPSEAVEIATAPKWAGKWLRSREHALLLPTCYLYLLFYWHLLVGPEVGIGRAETGGKTDASTACSVKVPRLNAHRLRPESEKAFGDGKRARFNDPFKPTLA